MKQLTKEQAIAFYENKCYENMTYRQIAEFQMEQDRLCMPFDVFHEAIEKTLGRPVFTHEFAFRDELRKELYGEKEPPTLEEICALIPKEKLILLKL
jgi:hypothetical protein